MKKTVSLVLLSGLLMAGCATTGNNTNTQAAANTAATPITLEDALIKAQTAREQLEQAKTTYQNVKNAAKASKENGSNFETELAKQAVQSKIDATKKQIDNEVNEWKEIFKN